MQVGGSNHSHATQDLYDNIAQGNYPEWTLYIQTMDPAQVSSGTFAHVSTLHALTHQARARQGWCLSTCCTWAMDLSMQVPSSVCCTASWQRRPSQRQCLLCSPPGAMQAASQLPAPCMTWPASPKLHLLRHCTCPAGNVQLVLLSPDVPACGRSTGSTLTPWT